MRHARSFEFIICIDDTGTSAAWLVEDRKHPPGSNDHRSSRIPVDLGLGDVRGRTPTRIAELLSESIYRGVVNAIPGHPPAL